MVCMARFHRGGDDALTCQLLLALSILGFSYCTKAGERQGTCHWDDVTQAEAYAHTLHAAKFAPSRPLGIHGLPSI